MTMNAQECKDAVAGMMNCTVLEGQNGYIGNPERMATGLMGKSAGLRTDAQMETTASVETGVKLDAPTPG